MTTSPSNHNFVILGAHIAGVATAHHLLKTTIPALSKITPSTTYHVIIVSPSAQFYHNISAPRALGNPESVPFSKSFLSWTDGFKQYKSEQYTVILGTATGLDAEARTVTVTTVSKEETQVPYSSLIIATGMTSNELWTVNDGAHERTIDALKALQTSIPTAQTILIAGGGAVGVETAGDIASYHPKVKVTLLSGTTRLLPRLLASNSTAAESRLKSLRVTVLHNVKVTSTSKTDDAKTTLVLSDGSSQTVDIYIEATGGKPNSSFLPPTWLDSTGRVLTDSKTMRVTVTGVQGVYAVGDIASYSDGGFMAVKMAIAPVCSSIAVDIATAAGKKDAAAQVGYKSFKDSQFVPTGPKGGVGQLFGYKVPSLMVWGIKSRTYMIEKAETMAKGIL